MRQPVRAQSHVGITGQDLDRSVRFYQDLIFGIARYLETRPGPPAAEPPSVLPPTPNLTR